MQSRFSPEINIFGFASIIVDDDHHRKHDKSQGDKGRPGEPAVRPAGCQSEPVANQAVARTRVAIAQFASSDG